MATLMNLRNFNESMIVPKYVKCLNFDPVFIAYIGGAMAILFYISRLLGVAPLKFEYMDGGLKATVSRCVAIYCYVLTFAVHASGVYCIYMANLVQEKQELQDIALFPLLNYLLTVCTLIASGMASYCGVRRFKRTFSYLIILKKICYNIQNNDSNPNHKLMVMMLTYLISIAIYIIVSEMFVFKFENVYIKCMNFCYFFQFYQISLIGVENACIQLEIQQVLKKVTKKLHQLNDGLNSDSITLNIIRSKSEVVRALTDSYITICELVSAVDINSGGTMFLTFGNTVICLTLSFCGLMDVLVLARNGQAIQILIQLIWITLYTITTLLFIEPCHRITEEVIEIRIQLTRLVYGVTPVGRPIRLELDLMYQQLILNEPIISPLQMFTVQRSLLSKTIAFMTTYLVSILQYIQNERWKSH